MTPHTARPAPVSYTHLLTGLFTKGKNIPTTAQQTLPYREMYRDGVCRVADRYYTKTIEYEDINYQLAQSEDQAAIFDGWSACLNYFDSSLPFQLSFLNHRSRPGSRYSVNIPMQDDDYNSVRCEYVEMLENQIAKSNNGIVRTKLLTFGVNVDDLPTARARLERVEADICGNFKKLGVKCRSLSGLERLELLHGQLHPGSGSPFRFSWDMIPKTGLSTKDFIAPDSFDFRFSRLFRVGTTWGAASYLQILASELSDKLLAELLEMDAEMTITLHIQTVDQAAAVKSIKAKVSDIDKMKVDVYKRQGVQREHNKKLNNGLPILRKVPPKRDYGRYFCIMAEKGGTSHGGLTEKLSPFFHAKKQEVNAYGR